MNHEANTVAWKMGDLVIHDDDAKRADMLMKVISRIASGPRKGMFRTRYAYPQHQPKVWRTKVWVNSIEKLHDPKRFGIDTTRVPVDRFSRDLEERRITNTRGEQLHALYASIRKSSEYHGQTKPGALFPVSIGGGYGDYIVAGNSNQYRLRDLRFYVRVGDRFICLEKKSKRRTS